MRLGRAPGRDGSLLKVPLTKRPQALAAERAGAGELHPRGGGAFHRPIKSVFVMLDFSGI